METPCEGQASTRGAGSVEGAESRAWPRQACRTGDELASGEPRRRGRKDAHLAAGSRSSSCARPGSTARTGDGGAAGWRVSLREGRRGWGDGCASSTEPGGGRVLLAGDPACVRSSSLDCTRALPCAPCSSCLRCWCLLSRAVDDPSLSSSPPLLELGRPRWSALPARRRPPCPLSRFFRRTLPAPFPSFWTAS